MAKYVVNMRSAADMVEGHGVLSAYREMVGLVKTLDEFDILENSMKRAHITHYHTVNLSYFLGIPFAKLFGKTVGYVHFLPETVDESLNLPKLARTVFYTYLIQFYKSMDRLVTVNPCFIEKLESYGIPKERIAYIPNFVSNKKFCPLPKEEKKALREEYGLDPEKFTIVCAGQLQTRKGVMDFVDLAQRLPEMQFFWAGGFSFGMITEGYAEISHVAHNPPSNMFFPGMVPRGKMNEIYNMGDVMLLPSYGELFPMTVLEAMSCHTPVLLRDLDIYPQILFDFYAKAHTQEEFCEQLVHMATDEHYYAQVVDASVRGSALYNASNVKTMWQTFYTDLLYQPSGSRERATVSSGTGANISALK